MFLTLRDLTYHVEIDGAGPPLVLLHGFTGSIESWQALVPQLSRIYTVIRVDLPGHGQTELPADVTRYAMPSTAHDLSLLLAQLAVAPVRLWGYSLGARLALFLALHWPSHISHLYLESGSPGLASEAERRVRRASDEALARRIEQAGIAAFVREWEGLPLWASQRRLNAVERQRLHEQRLRNRPVGLAHSLRQMGTGAQPSLWARLADLSMPIDLIVGAEDPKFVQIAKQMQTHLPHAHLNVVSKAGHAVHLEQPQIVQQVLAHFKA